MSASSSVGDFDLNVVKLRKPLDASGQDILDVGTLEVNTQIQLTPSGNTVNFLGEINQVATGVSFAGNQLTNSLINTGEAQGSRGLSVRDVGAVNGLYVLPNSPNNLFNPLVNAGDVSVIGTSASATLTLSNNNSTTNGVKITGIPAEMTMGVGGTGDNPTNRIVFNNPVNTIAATSVSGMTIQSADISPTPTLKVKESSTNNALAIIPKSDGAQYNPMDTSTAVELVAEIDGTTFDNGQLLAIVPHSQTSCGVRMAAGTGTSGTNAYLEVGCGGTGADPSQRIRFNNATSQIQMTYTGLSITTSPLPASAGASASLYLPITINNVVYKIALLNNA